MDDELAVWTDYTSFVDHVFEAPNQGLVNPKNQISITFHPKYPMNRYNPNNDNKTHSNWLKISKIKSNKNISWALIYFFPVLLKVETTSIKFLTQIQFNKL